MLLDQHGFPVTRVVADGGEVIVQRVQDVQDILDNNVALQNEPQTRAGTFRHIGSIPLAIYEQIYTEQYERGNTEIELFGEEMNKLVMRKLRDSDFRKLVCAPGVI